VHIPTTLYNKSFVIFSFSLYFSHFHLSFALQKKRHSVAVKNFYVFIELKNLKGRFGMKYLKWTQIVVVIKLYMKLCVLILAQQFPDDFSMLDLNE
jgi:hypothetical protein